MGHHKRVSVAVPDLKDGIVVPGEQLEVLFKNEQNWESFLQKCELAGVVDKETGTRRVYAFEELEDGMLYTGLLRPSSGTVRAINTLQGADRSRINAAEQEFGQALLPLVAHEEGVSLADVELVGGPADASLLHHAQHSAWLPSHRHGHPLAM